MFLCDVANSTKFLNGGHDTVRCDTVTQNRLITSNQYHRLRIRDLSPIHTADQWRRQGGASRGTCPGCAPAVGWSLGGETANWCKFIFHF